MTKCTKEHLNYIKVSHKKTSILQICLNYLFRVHVINFLKSIHVYRLSTYFGKMILLK